MRVSDKQIAKSHRSTRSIDIAEGEKFIPMITMKKIAEKVRTNGRTMYLSRLVTFAVFLTLVPVSHLQAQVDQGAAGGSQTQELVDHLKELIRGAEKDQRSNPWLSKQLRELVRRYDWPWRVSLLHDDFRDGDYTYDPSWIVSNGDFRVVRGSGLRTVFDTTRQGRRVVDRKGDNPAMDLLEGIFGGGRERAAKSDLQTPSLSTAEIYTRLSITNAFAVKLQLKSRGNPDGDKRIEFGPYLNDERNLGYRLAYESGNRPSLSLLRIAPGRSSIIETYDRGLDLEDGNPHIIEWRRADDGEMIVLLDDKEIIRTVDRAHPDSFNGFDIVNKGGVYELKAPSQSRRASLLALRLSIPAPQSAPPSV
jgi:hypothetical protein